MPERLTPTIEQARAIAPHEAHRLVSAFRLPGEQVYLQTFADGPEDLYSKQEKTGKNGKKYTVSSYGLTDPETGKLATGKVSDGALLDVDKLPGGYFRRANLARVGVFWTVNVLAEDAKRRTTDNVARAAAVFLDLDGAPLPASFPLVPTAIVESSPGKWHVYWAVQDVPLDEFTTLQKYLAVLYGADLAVCDLPRVMRLPGYWHGKREPGFLTRIHSLDAANQYTRADLLEAWPVLATALAAAEREQAEREQDAARRRAEADQLRAQVDSAKPADKLAAQKKWAQAALLGGAADVLEAKEGKRNYTLNAAAYRLGRIVAAGVLDESEAITALTDAARENGLPAGEIGPTLASGLEKGKETPHDLANIGTHAGKKNASIRVGRGKAVKGAATEKGPYILPEFPQGTQEGTDEANAVILASNGLGALLRYTPGLGWYAYDLEAGVWRVDPELVRAAPLAGAVLRAVVGQYLKDLLDEDEPNEGQLKRVSKWAAQVCNVGAVSRALQAAAGKPEFLTMPETWDAHKHLLNCRNGVLDLSSGELLPHDPQYLMTWLAGAAYDPTAKHAYVDRLTDLLKQDARHDFLQRTVGSALYGEAPNEVITVLDGEGGTGKGTLTDGVVGMLGDYAGTIDINLLLSNPRGESGTGPKPELLMLRGKRLAVAGEPPQGARWNAGRVKGMSGNDPITARNMHSPSMVTFSPVFKLWIHTNYPIAAAYDDSGMQRRLKVVPFRAKPAKLDPDFKRTLKDDPAARSAMLNWALEGCMAWLASGYDLGESEAVAQATGTYWKDQNPYEKFASERLVFKVDAQTQSGTLKTAFETWAEENGIKLGRLAKMADLYAFLREHGCEPKHTKGGNFWLGTELAVNPVNPVNPIPQFSEPSTCSLEKTGEMPSPPSPPSPPAKDDVSPTAEPDRWEAEI